MLPHTPPTFGKRCVLCIDYRQGYSRFVYPAIRPIERTYPTDLYPFGKPEAAAPWPNPAIRPIERTYSTDLYPFGKWFVWK